MGDVVELLKLGTRATVLACNKDGSYRLQAGILQLNAKPSEVYLLEQAPKPVAKTHPKPSGQTLHTQAAPAELDLRGMDSIEAISVLDQYLDLALRTKRSPVRIIHGRAPARCGPPFRANCGGRNLCAASAWASTAKARAA